MDEKPEVIRHRIEETRTALTEKLETLEREVRGTVRDAREAVTCTAETVRDAVNSTVASVRDTFNTTVEDVREKVHETAYTVKETFNLDHQVRAHPWAMFGSSVAVGMAVGTLLPGQGGGSRRGSRTVDSLTYAPGMEEPSTAQSSVGTVRSNVPSALSDASHKAAGLLSGLMKQFAPEIDKLKGLAIGTAVGLVRDMVRDQVPQHLAADFEEMTNSITTKLGGVPVQGPVLEAFRPREPQYRGERAPYRERGTFCGSSGARDREDPGERRFDL
jgi:ElaB/YqjD/DUF883 family membrane-anchored ribosome-binding protein